jgi:hypothetical protein
LSKLYHYFAVKSKVGEKRRCGLRKRLPLFKGVWTAIGISGLYEYDDSYQP